MKTFDQKNKIKVIKEVRGVTSLGLKEVSLVRHVLPNRSANCSVVCHSFIIGHSVSWCSLSCEFVQAKELVESSPCTILTKVKKEDAAKIIEKLKADTGAEFELI